MIIIKLESHKTRSLLRVFCNILLSLCLCCFSLSPARAELSDIFNNIFFDNYPEEKNKEIHINKGSSPLNQNKFQRNTIPGEKNLEDLDQTVANLLTEIGFNKFSLGTGMVDVTFQVRDGVKYALEDTFSGYAEFQRRKMLEEILNSNAKANAQTTEFLLISSGLKEESFGLLNAQDWTNIFEDYFAFPEFSYFSGNSQLGAYRTHNILEISKSIINTSLIKDLNSLLAAAAISLLMALLGINIFSRLIGRSSSLGYSIQEPLLGAALSSFLIYSSYHLLKLCFDAAYFINQALGEFSQDNGLGEIINLDFINQSWENLANQVGYFPSIVLSLANMLAQFFVYIYIAGLLLQLILGFIIAPVWALAYSCDKLKGSALTSFISWLKALLTVNFVPVIYLSFSLINQELKELDLDILNISFSIASLLLLPLISKLILGEASGNILGSGFWGYEMALQNIESSYNQLRATIQQKQSV